MCMDSNVGVASIIVSKPNMQSYELVNFAVGDNAP